MMFDTLAAPVLARDAQCLDATCDLRALYETDNAPGGSAGGEKRSTAWQASR